MAMKSTKKPAARKAPPQKAAKPVTKKAAPAKRKPAVPKAAKPLSAAEKLEAFGMGKICERTAEITPQRTIAAEIGVSWATMMAWIDKEPSRVEQYARAREAQADKLTEDMLEIADDASGDTMMTENGPRMDAEYVARSRLRVDARKWLASKMAPKRYGDKLTAELTGKDGAPIEITQIQRVIVDPKK